MAYINGNKTFFALVGGGGISSTLDISEDGYWVINGIKTVHKAVGKSAYEYAVDGGYPGTETEFGTKLAYIIGQPLVGRIDGTVIRFTGHVPDGTYTVAFDMEDGSTVDIGNLEKSTDDPSVIVNLLEKAYDTDLQTVYNDVGWAANMKVRSSGAVEGGGLKCILTGLIKLGDNNDVFHIRGVESVTYASGSDSGYYSCWDSSGAFIEGSRLGIPDCIGTDANGDFTLTMDHSKWTLPSETVYIRFQFGSATGSVIMTRNKLIPK